MSEAPAATKAGCAPARRHHRQSRRSEIATVICKGEHAETAHRPPSPNLKRSVGHRPEFVGSLDGLSEDASLGQGPCYYRAPNKIWPDAWNNATWCTELVYGKPRALVIEAEIVVH